MLWFGYIYYFLFNIIFLSSFLFIVRKLLLNTSSQTSILNLVYKFFTLMMIFIFFFTSIFLYYILDIYQSLIYINFDKVFINSYLLNDYMYHTSSNFYNLVKVYYFPFIYVFIVVTTLSIIFCLTYNQDELNSFMSYILVIFVAGYSMFFTDSLLILFLSYETLLIPSFFILYKFAKTRKCVEAAYLMFFWTQFGAMFLIFGILYIILINNSSLMSSINSSYYSNFEVNFIFLCLIFGFGVKLPIWPFYGWLPKAHVEASTNFSIFLSGVLVKFAFFGLLKILLTIQLEPTFVYLIPFLFIGMFDSVMKLFYQIDLKKLVAYSTVVEMHWLTICLVSGQSNLMLASFCMLISHALISTNSFLIVDAIARRWKTRLITEISGVNFATPKLFIMALINLLIFLGFPGSLFFVSEFLFFSFLFEMFPLLTFILLVLLYLLAPTFFFRSWMNVIFGYSNILKSHLPVDLSSRELLVFSSVSIMMYWLGISWQSFIL